MGSEVFEFRERDVAVWLGMPQASLKSARPKNAPGIALIGGFVMYDRSYLESLLVQFGLAEKTAAGCQLIEGLVWGALEELTRAWASQGAGQAAKNGAGTCSAVVVRHLMNPFLFVARVTGEGPQKGVRVNVAVKRREERLKYKPGAVVEIAPLAGRPVWAVVRPDAKKPQPAPPEE